MRAWLVLALLLGLTMSAFAAPQYASDLVAAADSAAADGDDAVGEADGAEEDSAEEAAVEAEAAAAEEEAAAVPPPPPPPPPPRRPSPPPVVKSQSPLKAFRGMATKPLKAAGVPDGIAEPLTLVIAGAAAAVAFGIGPFARTAVSAAVADALTAEPVEEEESLPPSRDNSDDLWLDRQIDKAIDFLKGLLGR